MLGAMRANELRMTASVTLPDRHQEYTATVAATFRVDPATGRPTNWPALDAFCEAANGLWPMLRALADAGGDPALPAGVVPLRRVGD